MTNPEVYKYLGDGSGIDEEIAQKMVTFFSFSACMFAVVEKASGDLIGHCGIRPIQDGRIELLYAYDPSAWKRDMPQKQAEQFSIMGRRILKLMN